MIILDTDHLSLAGLLFFVVASIRAEHVGKLHCIVEITMCRRRDRMMAGMTGSEDYPYDPLVLALALVMRGHGLRSGTN